MFPDSLALGRFQKHKEELEARKKKEEEEAAKVNPSLLVNSFICTSTYPHDGPITLTPFVQLSGVRGLRGVIRSGRCCEKTNWLRPVSLLPPLRALPLFSSASLPLASHSSRELLPIRFRCNC